MAFRRSWSCYGSYADDGSDIDVMLHVGSFRQTIQEKHWQIGEAAAEVLIDFGMFIQRTRMKWIG